VITCEHASRDLPGGLRAGGAAETRVLASHWGWDIGAWALATRVARSLEASAVGGRWSRLVIDLNRPVADPTLVRREAEGVPLSWNARLTAAEIERRMLLYHVPYHAAIDSLVIARLARGVRPLLLAMHTFTGHLDGERREFDAGVLFDRSLRHARSLAAGLRSGGLSVRYNEPYSGLAGMMYSIHRHGSHHGLPCLELEVNQERLASRLSVDRFARIIARAVRSVLKPPSR
jgi:predicted N-formylglutamate amidohydrolase